MEQILYAATKKNNIAYQGTRQTYTSTSNARDYKDNS